MSYQANTEYADMPIPYTMDDNYQKHALWDSTLISADTLGGYNRIFSTQNVEMIGEEITKRLNGLDPYGRPIVYPSDKIVHVLNQIYQSQLGRGIGDMYSRFHINGINERDEVQTVNEQAINLIYNAIKNEIEMTECNNRLDVFDTILGEHNKQGLRSHSKIFTNNKRGNTFEFHMRY